MVNSGHGLGRSLGVSRPATQKGLKAPKGKKPQTVPWYTVDLKTVDPDIDTPTEVSCTLQKYFFSTQTYDSLILMKTTKVSPSKVPLPSSHMF